MSTSTPSTPAGSSSSDLNAPARKRSGTVGTGVAVAIAIVLLLVGLGGGYLLKDYLTKNNNNSGNSAPVQLTETGSSLLYPLMTAWAGAYTGATISAASTGSGTGQSDAEQGLVNMGASDGYVSNASATNIVNFPAAISAQLIYYNLGSGFTSHLNLNGTVLAMIYSGKITSWTDPMILNAQSSGVQTALKALSSTTIHPIKRSDSSGDTFLFSSLCQMSWSGWTYGASTSALTGDTSATGATGNSGVVSALGSTANSIGYVGISYEASAASAKLAYAAVGDNESLSATGGTTPSNYILPSAANVSQDANLGLQRLQFNVYGLAVSLILGGSYLGAINLSKGGGGSNPTPSYPTPYPIVNLEYLLVKLSPPSGSSTVTSATLTATETFLEWALSTGNWASPGSQSSYITGVNFVPLTPAVTGYDMQEIASIHP